MQKTMKNLVHLPPESCNLIFDIWSSRQNMSVLGITVQYITAGWKIRNEVLGFRHFPEAHSSENIKNLLHSFMADFGLLPEQVNLYSKINP